MRRGTKKVGKGEAPDTTGWFGSKDVAHILDICPDDALCLARGGKIKAVKVGRYWKFSPESVRAYKRKMERERGAAKR